MNRLDWLDTATKKIYFRPDRKAVRRELEAHLEDLLEASGLDEDAALKEMGDPEAIAEELGRLHRPWLGYLWRASQLALLGAAVMYCLVLAMLAARPGYSYRAIPGMRLYHYLQADMDTIDPARVLEERVLSPSTVLETGGYTISLDQAVFRRVSESDSLDQAVFRRVSESDGPQWNLYIALDITSSRWEEPLDYWFSLSGGRTDAGPMEYGFTRNTSHWGFWQKCGFEIEGLPEDTEWVELDFGYGKLKRTLHISLTEEAET